MLSWFRRRAQEKVRLKARERFNELRTSFTQSTGLRIQAAGALAESNRWGMSPVEDAQLTELLNRAQFGLGDRLERQPEDLGRDLTRAIIVADDQVLTKAKNRIEAYVSDKPLYTRYPRQCVNLIHAEAANTWKFIVQQEAWGNARFTWYSGGGKIQIHFE